MRPMKLTQILQDIFLWITQWLHFVIPATIFSRSLWKLSSGSRHHASGLLLVDFITLCLLFPRVCNNYNNSYFKLNFRFCRYWKLMKNLNLFLFNFVSYRNFIFNRNTLGLIIFIFKFFFFSLNLYLRRDLIRLSFSEFMDKNVKST